MGNPSRAKRFAIESCRMSSHQGKQRILLSLVLAAWPAGISVAGPIPTPTQASLKTVGAEKPAPVMMQNESAVDPTIERGSRGVARTLLLAGIGVAAVIAVLSGVFAFRHKKQ